MITLYICNVILSISGYLSTFIQSINKTTNWSLYEKQSKLETTEDQAIGPRELLQNASAVITKCGSFTKGSQIYYKLQQLIY